MSIYMIFYIKLCVCCTNERYKTNQMGFSFCNLGHAPGVGLWALGVPGGGGGGGGGGGAQKYFLNMVMWHIKLTGMTSRTK